MRLLMFLKDLFLAVVLFGLVIWALVSCNGCATQDPSWTNATPEQRANGQFKFDYDYIESAQADSDRMTSYTNGVVLRQEIRRNARLEAP